MSTHQQNDDGTWGVAEPIGWQEEHGWFARFLFWLRGEGHCGKPGYQPRTETAHPQFDAFLDRALRDPEVREAYEKARARDAQPPSCLCHHEISDDGTDETHIWCDEHLPAITPDLMAALKASLARDAQPPSEADS